MTRYFSDAEFKKKKISIFGYIPYLCNMIKEFKFLSYFYDMIYLLPAIGLSAGGRIHINTQTIHRTIQNKQYFEQQIWKSAGRAPPGLVLCVCVWFFFNTFIHNMLHYRVILHVLFNVLLTVHHAMILGNRPTSTRHCHQHGVTITRSCIDIICFS